MFNVGSQEILIVLVLVFLLFGPRHIPEVARTIGKGMGELKRTLHGVEESVRRTTSELPGINDLDDRKAGNAPSASPKVTYHKATDDASSSSPKRTPDPFYTSQEGSATGDSKNKSSGESGDS